MDLPITNLPPGDPELVEKIVGMIKSKGIFDKFRKDCLADVDTKPAFQNLRLRVEGQVNKFLNDKAWKNDMNKNQLREGVRKNILESKILDNGIDAIINQVVTPKIRSLILPLVEDNVYSFLNIDKPRREDNEKRIMHDPHVQKDIPPLLPNVTPMVPPLVPPMGLPMNPMVPPMNPMVPPMNPMVPPMNLMVPPMNPMIPSMNPPHDPRMDSFIPQYERPHSSRQYSDRPRLREPFTPDRMKSDYFEEDNQKRKRFGTSHFDEPKKVERNTLTTDAISSEEDYILKRESRDQPWRIGSRSLQVSDALPMQEDNAVDSFDQARADSDAVSKGVERMSIKNQTEPMDIDKSVVKHDPIFDRQSLDSISSNSSGLSFSQGLDSKDKENPPPGTHKESAIIRSTQSTPLEDEKIQTKLQETTSSEESNSVNFIPKDLTSDINSGNSPKSPDTEEVKDEKTAETSELFEDASPISVEEPHGSVGSPIGISNSAVESSDSTASLQQVEKLDENKEDVKLFDENEMKDSDETHQPEKLDETENLEIKLDENKEIKTSDEVETEIKKIDESEKEIKKSDESDKEIKQSNESEKEMEKSDESEKEIKKEDESEKDVEKLEEGELKVSEEIHVEKLEETEGEIKQLDENISSLSLKTEVDVKQELSDDSKPRDVEEKTKSPTEDPKKMDEQFEHPEKSKHQSSTSSRDKDYRAKSSSKDDHYSHHSKHHKHRRDRDDDKDKEGKKDRHSTTHSSRGHSSHSSSYKEKSSSSSYKKDGKSEGKSEHSNSASKSQGKYPERRRSSHSSLSKSHHSSEKSANKKPDVIVAADDLFSMALESKVSMTNIGENRKLLLMKRDAKKYELDKIVKVTKVIKVGDSASGSDTGGASSNPNNAQDQTDGSKTGQKDPSVANKNGDTLDKSKVEEKKEKLTESESDITAKTKIQDKKKRIADSEADDIVAKEKIKEKKTLNSEIKPKEAKHIDKSVITTPKSIVLKDKNDKNKDESKRDKQTPPYKIKLSDQTITKLSEKKSMSKEEEDKVKKINDLCSSKAKEIIPSKTEQLKKTETPKSGNSSNSTESSKKATQVKKVLNEETKPQIASGKKTTEDKSVKPVHSKKVDKHRTSASRRVIASSDSDSSSSSVSSDSSSSTSDTSTSSSDSDSDVPSKGNKENKKPEKTEKKSPKESVKLKSFYKNEKSSNVNEKRPDSSNTEYIVLENKNTDKNDTGTSKYSVKKRKLDPLITSDSSDNEVVRVKTPDRKRKSVESMKNRRQSSRNVSSSSSSSDEDTDIPLGALLNKKFDTKAKISPTLESNKVTPVKQNVTVETDIKKASKSNPNQEAITEFNIIFNIDDEDEFLGFEDQNISKNTTSLLHTKGKATSVNVSTSSDDDIPLNKIAKTGKTTKAAKVTPTPPKQAPKKKYIKKKSPANVSSQNLGSHSKAKSTFEAEFGHSDSEGDFEGFIPVKKVNNKVNPRKKSGKTVKTNKPSKKDLVFTPTKSFEDKTALFFTDSEDGEPSFDFVGFEGFAFEGWEAFDAGNEKIKCFLEQNSSESSFDLDDMWGEDSEDLIESMVTTFKSNKKPSDLQNQETKSTAISIPIAHSPSNSNGSSSLSSESNMVVEKASAKRKIAQNSGDFANTSKRLKETNSDNIRTYSIPTPELDGSSTKEFTIQVASHDASHDSSYSPLSPTSNCSNENVATV